MSALPIIHTARTIMRVPGPEYAAQLLAYRIDNRDHLAPVEPARPAEYFTVADARRWLEQAQAEAHAGTGLHFLAFERAGSRLVASCGFSNIVRGVFQACYLGFSVDARSQGRGLMREVAAAGIAHMFAVEGLHRIMANHLPHNARSAALLARLGFEREGHARAYLRIAGRWEDMILTALINPA